ncbi:CATRA system-associated protein [Actinomadura welshii]
MSPSDSTASDDPDSGEAAELLELLDEMPEWSLSGERWNEVKEALDAAERALDSGDGDALRESVETVESADPSRMSPLGEEDDEPDAPAPVTMPGPVRERRDVLRDRLAAVLDPVPGDPASGDSAG